ncbi:hypothetical protein D3C71_1521880 [compost metagenome]
MNHLSYSLASEPSLIWRTMESSTAFLKAASSLRIMQAMGSTDSTSPTILKSAGFFALEMLPARMEPSITNASARPVSSSRKLSAWSLPRTSLKLMPSARLFLRSVCTDVVPVVVATVLPLRSLMPVMPELALVAIRTSSTYVVMAKATSFWRLASLVVEPHSRSTVPLVTRGIRFCDVTGWRLMSSLARPSCFWMSAKMCSAISV